MLNQIKQKLLLVILATFAATVLVSCDLSNPFGDSELSASVPLDSSERANPGVQRDNTPRMYVISQPGAALQEDSTASLDYSNAADGYICAKSNVDPQTKVKVLVNNPDGSQYRYTLRSNEGWVTIPLTIGNGTYQFDVYKNLYDDQYTAAFSVRTDVTLNNEFAPFLNPNQYSTFNAEDQVAQLSREITLNATSDVEAVDQIYMYIVQNIEYDYDEAASVKPGYLPDNFDTLAKGKGICFDYASLMTSMLRLQGLPTKLVIGYCGQAYHAWIEVYTTDSGWIRKKIEFPGNAYVLMDPTFDSAGQGKGDISKIIGDGSNYNPIEYH